jgi:hypothetical protein
MVKKGVEWLDRKSSRRGFLARIGKVVAAAGAALAAQPLLADTAEAANCCAGVRASCCQSTIGSCCSGYTYTGYTWYCCSGPDVRAYVCWDCRQNSSGLVYYCNRQTQLVC